uniref:Receptor protein serine/threonine kinase n=1 Tax=Panagrolaimus sp. PS1159 TaxID=55785 RepID=A0AC35EZQ4_9BILA
MIHQIQTGKLVGNGKFGKVYDGIYRGEKVAIKKFSANHSNSWKRETEVYQAASLKNPCILQWVGSDEQRYSYKPRIVHRDIKPTNILVRNNFTCVIADFGLAIYCYYNDVSHEAESQIKGTPRYCAPEKLQNLSLSKKFPSMLEQDVYSLSLVLWKICQRMGVIFDENGKLPSYRLCFATEISENPTVAQMIVLLLEKKQRPEFSAEWLKNNQMLESFVEIIKEAWHENGTVRPTALKIRNILDKVITDNHLNVFPA